jgi:hypothetical protein
MTAFRMSLSCGSMGITTVEGSRLDDGKIHVSHPGYTQAEVPVFECCPTATGALTALTEVLSDFLPS